MHVLPLATRRFLDGHKLPVAAFSRRRRTLCRIRPQISADGNSSAGTHVTGPPFPKASTADFAYGAGGEGIGLAPRIWLIKPEESNQREKKKHLKHHGIGTIPESGQGQAAKAVGWLDFPILMDLFTSYAAISWFTRSTAMLWRIVLVC